jgi:hypothetical protein
MGERGRCSECEGGIDLPSDWDGRRLKCPSCFGVVEVRRQRATEPPAKQSAAAYLRVGTPAQAAPSPGEKPPVPALFPPAISGLISNAWQDYVSRRPGDWLASFVSPVEPGSFVIPRRVVARSFTFENIEQISYLASENAIKLPDDLARTSHQRLWISVRDRKPQPMECVDVWHVRVGRVTDCMLGTVACAPDGKPGEPAMWFMKSGDAIAAFDVTHWMPRPPAPES